MYKRMRLIVPLMGLLVLSGCSKASFEADKNALLKKTSAMDGDATGSISQPGSPGNGILNPPPGTGSGAGSGGSGGTAGGSPSGTPSPGSSPSPGGENGGVPGGGISPGGSIPDVPIARQPHQPDGTDDEVDLTLMCSDRRSGDATNFKSALANNRPVQLLVDKVICTPDANAIKGLVQKKSITIKDLQSICPTLVPSQGKWANISVVLDGKAYNSTKGSITLLYALNQQKEPANEVADENCDTRASPLVVHLNSNPDRPRPISLSSQARGVWFDLLGDRNNHQAVKISWFTNLDYGFVALPDSSGAVRSIDQLFGNSTVGPDGRFADNGYEALAKYDGMSSNGSVRVSKADGIIDASDPVFDRLRIWIDRNFDGVAGSGELVSLSDIGIAFIDLRYSSKYAESDRYGNQTLMKSVVGRSDGSLDLIFDLWFSYRYGGY